MLYERVIDGGWALSLILFFNYSSPKVKTDSSQNKSKLLFEPRRNKAYLDTSAKTIFDLIL